MTSIPVTYEYVDFFQQSAKLRVKRTGIRVGEYLVVAYTDRISRNRVQIYGRVSGRPIIKMSFPGTTQGVEDAIQMAQWLDQVYREYFDLWQDYPEWDIVSLARWTVPNGLQIFLAVDALKDQIVSLPDIKQAFQSAKHEVPNWTRFY